MKFFKIFSLRSFIAYMVSIITVLTVACDIPSPVVIPQVIGEPGDRQFYIFHTHSESSLTNPYQIGTNFVAENEHVQIYVSTTESISSELVHRILQSFSEADTGIYDRVTRFFDSPSDMDNNGKVIIVFHDIQDGYNPSSPYSRFISGQFDPNDLLRRNFSNRAEIVYIDTNPTLNFDREWDQGSEIWEIQMSYLLRTIAHELQHLTQFSNQKYGEEWLIEGLAISAEEIYTGAPLRSDIIDYFHDSTGRIASGNNFFNWNGGTDYHSVYLFFYYLRTHGNGTTVYRDIYNNSGMRNFRAITELIHSGRHSDLSAIANIPNDHENTWQRLLAHFFAATVVQSFGESYDSLSHSNQNGMPITFDSTGDELLGFKGFQSINRSTRPISFPRELILSYIGDRGLFTVANAALGSNSAELRSGDRLITVNTLENGRRSIFSGVSPPTNSPPGIQYYGIDFDNVIFAVPTGEQLVTGISEYIWAFENPRLIENPNSNTKILLSINTNTNPESMSKTVSVDSPVSNISSPINESIVVRYNTEQLFLSDRDISEFRHERVVDEIIPHN